jgi:hypothetical protein
MAPEPVAPSDVLAWFEILEIPRWRWRTFWSVVHHLDRQARNMTRSKRNDDPEASD